MDTIMFFVDLFLHLDKYLPQVIQTFGIWTYVLLFLVIFMETGLVVTPFLPGDSLLFAAGAVAAVTTEHINILLLWFLLFCAAFLGDTANYWIGHTIGPRAFSGNVRFLKKEYLDKTQAFYDKHGGKTIFLARFVPIVRTFAPFVAGVGRMRYGYFISYNLTGALVWTLLCTFGGYFFGNLPIVKNNFSFVVIAIVIISVLPAVVEYFRSTRGPKEPQKPLDEIKA
ncbi:MAG: DedA family protein [Anaerolineae bacterium]|nr:DedA family protein [Anaerolineae bacterium]